MKDEPRGLFRKYEIRKASGEPVDPGAVYFTLRLDTDPHARAAIRAYIESVEGENEELARDLRALLERMEEELFTG